MRRIPYDLIWDLSQNFGGELDGIAAKSLEWNKLTQCQKI
jgi:hypothetical protein